MLSSTNVIENREKFLHALRNYENFNIHSILNCFIGVFAKAFGSTDASKIGIDPLLLTEVMMGEWMRAYCLTIPLEKKNDFTVDDGLELFEKIFNGEIKTPEAASRFIIPRIIKTPA